MTNCYLNTPAAQTPEGRNTDPYQAPWGYYLFLFIFLILFGIAITVMPMMAGGGAAWHMLTVTLAGVGGYTFTLRRVRREMKEAHREVVGLGYEDLNDYRAANSGS